MGVPDFSGIQYLFTVPTCACLGAVAGLAAVLLGASGWVAIGLIVAGVVAGFWWEDRMR